MIIVVLPGKFGCMAGLTSNDEVVYRHMPTSTREFVRVVTSWMSGSKGPHVMYFDEFFMVNSLRLDLYRVDMAKMANSVGKLTGVGYALMDYVVPVDTRELLLADKATADGYDIGQPLETIAYHSAAKYFPYVKQSIENAGDMFFTLSPALALLGKVLDGECPPTLHDRVKSNKEPDSFLFRS